MLVVASALLCANFVERYNNSVKTRIPPPIVALAFACMMLALSELIPFGSFTLPANIHLWLSACSVLAGIVVMAAGVSAFGKSETTINPLKPEEATSLVVSSIYTRTRNPMYLGFLSILTGMALFLGSVLALCLLPFFVLYMNLFQIIPEEEALTKLFGDQYDNYCRDVRRWI
jgi:protein-S-isoprenylcysteine O-methyltransferase Ste14